MLLNTGLATAGAPTSSVINADSLTVVPLDDSRTDEVLAFLNERAASTFIMCGLIRDNGLESPLNRGTFYACCNREGCIEGVTLIGEITMLETRSEATVAAFARQAQSIHDIYMIIGAHEQIGRFWSYYMGAGQPLRLYSRELFFELRHGPAVHRPVSGLRQATLGELEQLMAIHAQMAMQESGVNPLEVDPRGFLRRCARRVEQGRTWVYTEGGRLIFKADVIAETPEITYLEGVYVSPEMRGQGYGVRCVSQLSRHLLTRTKSTCMLVNEQDNAAQALYRKAGYEARGIYDSIFLHKQPQEVAYC
jgi:ribosomal protein S18 acetylase RimI-like enzyme